MSDEWQAWLDEALGDQVRHLLILEPEVAARYHAAFRGDPVGEAWLLSVAGASPGAASVDSVADAATAGATDGLTASTVDDVLADPAYAEMAAELRSVEQELLEQHAEFADIPEDRRRELLAEVLQEMGAGGTPS